MDIIKLLDDYLLEKNDKEMIVTNHWPSNASCIVDDKIVGKCLRAQWYGWKRFKPSNPFELNALWVMFMGKCIHLGIQDILEKCKIKTLREEPAKYKLHGLNNAISGRIDILFQEEEDGLYSGIEIKSTYGRAIIDPVYGVKYTGPMGHHLVQCLPYMESSEDPSQPFPFHVLYLARDTGWRESFLLTYDVYKDILYCEGKPTGVTWRGIVDRWELLEKYLRGEEMPPRDFMLQYPDEILKPMWEEYIEHSKAKRKMTLKAYSKDRGDWMCKRCLYKDLCYNNLKPNEITEAEAWKQREGLSAL